MRKIFLYCLLLISAVACLRATLWRERNIYSSAENLQPGDTVIININDVTKIKFNIDLKNKNVSNVSSNPDMTITGFLPKIAADKSISNDDSIKIEGKGDIAIKLAATVEQLQPNGNYSVGGARQLIFNGIANTISVSGTINPKLLKGRSINSSDVTNFRMEIATTKLGAGMTINRPALQLDETANSNLTEQEKQQIIIDYLQKMLGELNR